MGEKKKGVALITGATSGICGIALNGQKGESNEY